MDMKKFKEPKNSVGQSPLDCCVDAFEEVLTDAEIAIHHTDRETFNDALEEAIVTWEAIHHNG